MGGQRHQTICVSEDAGVVLKVSGCLRVGRVWPLLVSLLPCLCTLHICLLVTSGLSEWTQFTSDSDRQGSCTMCWWSNLFGGVWPFGILYLLLLLGCVLQVLVCMYALRK